MRAHPSALLIGLALCSCACSPPDPEPLAAPLARNVRRAFGSLRAGAARESITPPWPAISEGRVVMAGYGPCDRVATGVRDEVFVRALVLDDSTSRIALVSADLLVITRWLREAVVRRLAGLHLDGLILCATHTHSSIGGYADHALLELGLGSHDPSALEFLARRIAAAVRTASARLAPATLTLAAGSLRGVSTNRRRGGGPVDERLVTLTARGASGRAIARVVRFSAHPTSLGPANQLVSGNYPGALARGLEAAGGVCLFLSGAQGDQRVTWDRARTGPPLGKGRWDRVERVGRELARRVLKLESRSPAGASRVRLNHLTFVAPLPCPNVAAIPDFLWFFDLPLSLLGGLLWFPESTRISVLEVATRPERGAPWRLRLVFFPGEPTVASGVRIERAVTGPGVSTFAVALADDYIGYFLEPDDHDRGGYEALLSNYGRDAIVWLARCYRAVAGALGKGLK